MQSTARKLKLPPDKLVVTVDEHGNTSAASIPLALDTAVRSGRIKRGRHGAARGRGRRLHLGRGAARLLIHGQARRRAETTWLKPLHSSFPGRARRAWACSTPGATTRRCASAGRGLEALGEDVGRADPRRPEGTLDLTTNTQPVMLTAGMACYRAWLAETGPLRPWWPATRWANTARWWPPAR
jgi:hypothetical protein